MKKVAFSIVLALMLSCTGRENCFIETESFSDYGGWVMDNQAEAAMGSPYLIAHGLGIPVADASTVFNCPKAGTWHLWVRTRDWVAEWGKPGAPGRFNVLVNGTEAGEFGNEGADWHWQYGGDVSLLKGRNTLAIHDLTGFDGRCDAICFTETADEPTSRPKPGRAENAGRYDLVVVGGGLAGCAAAVSAARYGCKVALIQNRPVLGGNNSSEVRVGPSGLIFQKPYPKLGLLCDELTGAGHWTRVEALRDTTTERSRRILAELAAHPEKIQHNAGPASNYEDERKMAVVTAEKNIDLYLNTEVIKAETKNGTIRYVVARNIRDGRLLKFSGKQYADCTGDGNLGVLAGADYRVGRESRAETGEPRAPEKSDNLVMGTSVQWYAENGDTASAFPECPWAVEFDETTCAPHMRGDWDWETGLGRDQVMEIEHIRDYALRAVYGNWDYLKNRSSRKDEFADSHLEWVACIGGKRESRRLLGDVILSENDINNAVEYDDASFTTTWGADLHYPKIIPGFKEEPFRSYCDAPEVKPYAVPYRCLYSRNVSNLFMAGRDISVTHVALGTIRVMRTGCMMGEIVGMAAGICKASGCNPRGVYSDHLDELKNLMTKGVPNPLN